MAKDLMWNKEVYTIKYGWTVNGESKTITAGPGFRPYDRESFTARLCVRARKLLGGAPKGWYQISGADGKVISRAEFEGKDWKIVYTTIK